MKIKLTIHAFSPAPSKQLAALDLSTALLSKFDCLASSIITAFINGLITEKSFARAVRRLKRQIRRDIKKQTA